MIRRTRSRRGVRLHSSLLALGVCLGCGEAPPSDAAGDAPPAVAADTAAARPVADAEPPAAPREAPAFALEALDGAVVRSEDLLGKTVVIDFWATWCPPCEFQVPELNSFWASHRGDGDVVVLGVSVDVDTDDVVRDWVEQKGVEYRVLLGGEEVARRFGALGFPTLYVLAPDGTIAMDHVGLIEVADLEAALTKLRGS